VVEFGFARILAGKLAEHLVIRSAKRLHPRVVTAFKDALQMINSTLSIRRIGADRIVSFVRQDGYGGAFEAVVFDDLADVLEVRRIADVEDGNFDAVVTGCLEFAEEVEVSVSDVTGPEEKVEADFHAIRAASLEKCDAAGNTLVALFFANPALHWRLEARWLECEWFYDLATIAASNQSLHIPSSESGRLKPATLIVIFVNTPNTKYEVIGIFYILHK
jgi:hypothetical protein